MMFAKRKTYFSVIQKAFRTRHFMPVSFVFPFDNSVVSFAIFVSTFMYIVEIGLIRKIPTLKPMNLGI